jgi:hypothetical protein
MIKPVSEALPSPLEEMKPCASSLPPNFSRKIVSAFQIQSTLLGKLPAEIRMKIWKYAIGNQELHIISKYRRLGHAVCDAGYWAENQSERPDLRASSYMFTYGSLPRTKQLADWSMVNLLTTCRLMYVISLLLLFLFHRSTYPVLLPSGENIHNNHANIGRWQKDRVHSADSYCSCLD